jgi:hypothetical protein
MTHAPRDNAGKNRFCQMFAPRGHNQQKFRQGIPVSLFLRKPQIANGFRRRRAADFPRLHNVNPQPA